MRRFRLSVALASLVALLVVAPASSHHAFNAEFDATKPIKFKGTVTKMLWVNPHAWIYVDVKKPDGTVEEWMIETGTPNTLIRRGLTKESLPKGTEIVVDGYQSKDRSNRANGRDVTFTDGRKLFMGSSGTGAPLDGKDASEPARGRQ